MSSFFRPSFITLLLILSFTSYSLAQQPDPNCQRGIRGNSPLGSACCKRKCGVCGGKGCGTRSQQQKTSCCIQAIQKSRPSCRVTAAPCKLSSAPAPPQPGPAANNNVCTGKMNGRWGIAPLASNSGSLSKRHEACAVMVNGLVVLLGGRGFNRDVSIYNPKTQTWQNKKGPGSGIMLHHMQCVAYRGSVYVVSSWTGNYPFEQNNGKIYIYNVAADKWSTKPGLPPNRRRGGAASVLRNGIIYVIAGNQGGHGAHATSVGWMDAYNINAGTWNLNLPSMPSPRDHTGGALVNGMLCVAGGRDGGSANFFNNNKKETWCYNFGTRSWNRKPDMPAPRAGSSYGRSCAGNLIVAGGEGGGNAFDRVDEFDGCQWKNPTFLVDSRHGSGVATSDCSCGHMFIPSGSGNQGGSPELSTTERFVPFGRPSSCAKY